MILVEHCIEHIIKYSDLRSTLTPEQFLIEQNSCNILPSQTTAMDNLKIAYQNKVNIDSQDELIDADVIFESEEFQTTEAPQQSSNETYYQNTSELSTLNNNSLSSTSLSSSSGAIPKTNAYKLYTFQQPDYEQQPLNVTNSTAPAMSSFLKTGSNNFIDTTISNNVVEASNKTRPTNDFQQIYDGINQCCKVMIIMRGVPGSGKSHLARQIIDDTMKGDYRNHIFSSDDYFYDRHDRYCYEASRVPAAHEYNQNRVRKRAATGWSPIIVDNTMVRAWELYPYIDIGVKNGYIIELLEPKTPWSKSAGKLAIKNLHNVSKPSIERMLKSFEPTTVADTMKVLQLSYTMPLPQWRRNPPISIIPQKNLDAYLEAPTLTGDLQLESMPPPLWDSDWTAIKTENQNEDNSMNPKPQRSNNSNKRNISLSMTASSEQQDPADTFRIAAEQLEKVSNKWTTIESDQMQFWNTKNEGGDSNVSTNAVINGSLPQRKRNKKNKNSHNDKKVEASSSYSADNSSNMFSILRDRSNVQTTTSSSSSDETDANRVKPPSIPLVKHRKNCLNENKSFAQIRQIYPAVPIDILWDLFKHCEGDGDWTMDILLKEETKIDEYEDKPEDTSNFDCNCDQPKSTKEPVLPAAPENAVEPTLPMICTPTNSRSRRDRNQNEVAKKFIEENITISNEHYSDYILKLRNYRHGVVPEQPVDETAPAESNNQNEDVASQNTDEDNEILEIDLGHNLVQQLDNIFGVDAFVESDSMKQMKTNVFMPKALAQQLYALWMESVFNQVEEQRQKSIKEDEEFARHLNAQDNNNRQNLALVMNDSQSTVAPTNLRDIMDMQHAWQVYQTNVVDKWKDAPVDLAAQMTRDKLYERFPNVERDTIAEILAAHNNRFVETVDVLTHSLTKTNGLESERNKLFAKVQAESETVSFSFLIMYLKKHSISKNVSKTKF